MSGAPVKKLPASPRVSLSRVPVTDRGGEKVNVGYMLPVKNYHAVRETGYFLNGVRRSARYSLVTLLPELVTQMLAPSKAMPPGPLTGKEPRLAPSLARSLITVLGFAFVTQ